MTIATYDPSAEGTNAWTNPSNARADDGVYATAAPAKNLTVAGIWQTYGITDPGSGATISMVETLFQYKVDTASSVASITSEISWDGGTTWSTPATSSSEPLTDLWVITDVTSATSWTWAKLADSLLRVRITAIRGNSSTSVIFSLDAARVRVTYATITTVALTKYLSARIKATVALTKTLSSRIKTTTTLTKTLSSRVKTTTTLTKTVSGRVKVTTGVNKTLSARIKATQLITKYLGATITGLGVTYTLTKTLSARVKATASLTKSLGARVKTTNSVNKTLGARVKVTSTIARYLSARVKATATLTRTLGARIVSSTTITKQLNARIKATQTISKSLRARVGTMPGPSGPVAQDGSWWMR